MPTSLILILLFFWWMDIAS